MIVFLDGLIAEQFCYKLCLILSNVSVFCDPQLREQVRAMVSSFPASPGPLSFPG